VNSPRDLTMNWLVVRKKCRTWMRMDQARQMFELSMSLLVGLMIGTLVVFSWGLPSQWQEFIVAIPIALAAVMLVHDLDRLVLAAIAVGVPLNVDVSLLVSRYARNPVNMAKGYRTLVALTEFRISLVMVLLLVGYALWLVRSQDSDRKPARFFAGVTVPALGLVFISIVSVSQARDWQLSFFRIVQFFELFLTYFYLANHLRTIEDMQFFLLVSTGALFAESVLMIVQWMTGLEFIIAGVQAANWGKGVLGVAGTLGNKGAAAGYLSAQGLITCAAMWAFPKRKQRIFAAISFIASAIALVSTGSRIGWGAFAVTIVLYVLVGLLRGLIKPATVVWLTVGLLIVGAAFYRPIYARYTEDDHGSAESRPKMYRLAWNVINAHPWLGVGANNYALVARDYYTVDVGDLGYVIDSVVHNRYLLTWAESGLFGLMFYVGFLVSPIIRAVQCIYGSKCYFTRIIALGSGCGLISLCIQMYTGTFHTRSITLLTWLLPGLLVGLCNLGQPIASLEQTETSEGRDHVASSVSPLQWVAGPSYMLDDS
jgi:O-antigen ligase